MAFFTDDIRRAYYQNATTVDQATLDACLAAGENQLEFIVEVSLPDGTFLRLSDRPKYVGSYFYQGRIAVPKVTRKISELFSPSLVFSEIEIEVSNVDGIYNHLLVGGASYTPFFGQSIELKIGLRDLSASFISVFRGFIHYEGSVERGSKTFTLRARDQFEQLNKPLPLPKITATDFPSAPAESLGKTIPLVLGDWEDGFQFDSVAPVEIGTGITVLAKTAATTFKGGLVGYNVGGGYFVFSVGNYTPDTITDVLVKRGDSFLEANFSSSPVATAGYWSAQVTSLKLSGGGTTPYVFQQGDLACIKVKVPYEVGGYSNIVSIAKECLFVLCGVSASDLDATSWNYLEGKSSPASGNITAIKARVWIGDDSKASERTALSTVITLLKHVRVDLFIDRNRRIKLLSLALEDNPQPTAAADVSQFHVLEQSFRPEADKRSFFNSAAANYSYSPIFGTTTLKGALRTNFTSVSKSGKQIAKEIDFPWLYEESDVQAQVDEYVRFFSAGLEYVRASLTWNHVIRDLGEFVRVTFSVGCVAFDAVPMVIRELAVNPETGGVDVVLLSFANLPYPNYQPPYQDRMLSAYNQGIN
jgi:hypothetical protein